MGEGRRRSFRPNSLSSSGSAIDEGRLIRGAARTRHILGKMYLGSFLSGVAAPKLKAPSSPAEIHWANGDYMIDRLDE